MLVKNSDALRHEINTYLRNEYINSIKNETDSLQNNQLNIHLNAMDHIIRYYLTDCIYQFQALASAIKNHPVLPLVEEATLALVNDVNDETIFVAVGTTPSIEDLKRPTNENYTYPLKEPGFIPTDRLISYIGNNMAITYKKDDSNQSRLIIRTNIELIDPEKYSQSEVYILSPIIEQLKKIWIEYNHYKNIHSYFQTLFNELPSLNQMYKACPTILNYIGSKTTEKLFATIKERNMEKLNELKPTGEVSVALGRNKLRGKH